MTHEQMMIERLLVVAKELDGRPPYDAATMLLNAGEVSLLAKGYVEIRSRSEQRGDELFAIKSRLTGYVNEWRSGQLDATEAMIVIQALAETFIRK